MFLENFSKFLKYYGRGRYIRLCGFTGLSLIAGCLEFLGIALVYPFIMLIISPDTLPKTFKFIHLDNSLTNGLLIGLSVLVIFILKNLFIILNLYMQSKIRCRVENRQLLKNLCTTTYTHRTKIL